MAICSETTATQASGDQYIRRIGSGSGVEILGIWPSFDVSDLYCSVLMASSRELREKEVSRSFLYLTQSIHRIKALMIQGLSPGGRQDQYSFNSYFSGVMVSPETLTTM
jgi:hypothetical protein